jgi:GNAT superfamily N-acetyltransferase
MDRPGFMPGVCGATLEPCGGWLEPDVQIMLTIRRAALADVSRLAALSEVLGYPVDAGVLARRLTRLLARDENVMLVAVAPSGEVVGWIHALELELLEVERHCEIAGLVVDVAHRGQGAGRQLVEAAERWAAARGHGDMSVRSNVVRVESHPFYERMGYRRVKTQHAYRKALTPRGD